MDLRLTNSTQSIQSVVSQQINNTDLRSNKRRCRDFDEKVKNIYIRLFYNEMLLFVIIWQKRNKVEDEIIRLITGFFIC